MSLLAEQRLKIVAARAWETFSELKVKASQHVLQLVEERFKIGLVQGG